MRRHFWSHRRAVAREGGTERPVVARLGPKLVRLECSYVEVVNAATPLGATVACERCSIEGGAVTVAEFWVLAVLGAAIGGPPAVVLFEGLAAWRAARDERRFDLVRTLVRDDAEALDAFDRACQRPAGNPTGANQHTGTVDNINDSERPAHLHADVDNINIRPAGTSRDYALRRLRKDRRHLDETQRALIGARVATLKDGQRKVGQLAHVPTQAEAASLVGVGVRTIKRARTVLESGDAALIAQCERGEKRLGRAVSELKRAHRRDGSPSDGEFPSERLGSTGKPSTGQRARAAPG